MTQHLSKGWGGVEGGGGGGGWGVGVLGVGGGCWGGWGGWGGRVTLRFSDLSSEAKLKLALK